MRWICPKPGVPKHSLIGYDGIGVDVFYGVMTWEFETWQFQGPYLCIDPETDNIHEAKKIVVAELKSFVLDLFANLEDEGEFERHRQAGDCPQTPTKTY